MVVVSEGLGNGHSLGGDVVQQLRGGEAGLEEVLLVALHLNGPQPLPYRAAGRGGQRGTLVQQGVREPG